MSAEDTPAEAFNHLYEMCLYEQGVLSDLLMLPFYLILTWRKLSNFPHSGLWFIVVVHFTVTDENNILREVKVI